MTFDAEGYLDSLERLGMRFGLERMHKLSTLLGMPQNRFASVHVVGTNGKSSVTEMTAALLEAHGVRSGAYLSPHVADWRERVLVAGRPIGAAEFAAAVERVAQAIEPVNRTLEPGDGVTQFEAATAAAFVALAASRVEVGVIEAGLGGRLDATNVLPSKTTVLTSIGLEHTQWLGETELEIAAEKLAVLRDHSTLVLGAVSGEVADLARRSAGERHAAVIEVAPASASAGAGPARAPYLRRNFAVALATARTVLGGLDEERVADVATSLELHGRMETRGGDPPLILDAAHNPDGARALAEALPVVGGVRPVFAAVALLADKDAERFLAPLASVIDALIATEIPPERLARAGRPGAVALPAGDLAKAALRAGVGQVEELPDPGEAIERIVVLAREAGGVGLISGSHYLLGYVPDG